MEYSVNDRVVVNNSSLATHESHGLVVNLKAGLVHVLLDSKFIQYRNKSFTKIIKYSPYSLKLEKNTDSLVKSVEHAVTLILWGNEIDDLYSAEVATLLHCVNEEDAKDEAAKTMQQDTNLFYWISITKPSQVELVFPKVTIRKV
jgi:hypothetical protein